METGWKVSLLTSAALGKLPDSTGQDLPEVAQLVLHLAVAVDGAGDVPNCW